LLQSLFLTEFWLAAAGLLMIGGSVGVAMVLTLWNTWVLVLAPGILIGALLSFSGLWGVPYLRARFNLPAELCHRG